MGAPAPGDRGSGQGSGTSAAAKAMLEAAAEAALLLLGAVPVVGARVVPLARHQRLPGPDLGALARLGCREMGVRSGSLALPSPPLPRMHLPSTAAAWALPLGGRGLHRAGYLDRGPGTSGHSCSGSTSYPPGSRRPPRTGVCTGLLGRPAGRCQASLGSSKQRVRGQGPATAPQL